MEEDKLYCPHCGSSQLYVNKKGFGVGKAAAGMLLVGGIGLLAGFVGSRKLKVTCLKCGNKCDVGKLSTTPLPPKKEVINEDDNINAGCAMILIAIGIWAIILFCATCS